MSSRTLKILNLVSKGMQNNIVPVPELPVQELPNQEFPVHELPVQELPVQELLTQENGSVININDIPIVFEDQLLSALSCGNSQSHNQTSDQCMVENNNQNSNHPNQSLPYASAKIISKNLRSENVTFETPSTSGISCSSKRKVEENSDFESCSSGSVYEPEQTEESSSRVSEERQEINLIETQLEQPMYGNMEEGRKRKKKAIQEQWKKKRNEKLREKGKEYFGYSRSRNGSVKQDSMRPERNMGQACNSRFCRKSSKRQCDAFSEEKRKELFEHFWSSLSWDQKKIYVCSHVSRAETQKKTATLHEISRREGSFNYTLSNGQIKVPVCREFFLSTLGLRPFTVQSWVKQSINGMRKEKQQQNEKRKSKNYRVKKFNEQNEYLNNFFKELPKQPSHYVRKNTSKLYLEEHFTSMKQLFDKYSEKFQEDGVTPLGRYVFEKTFKEDKSVFVFAKEGSL